MSASGHAPTATWRTCASSPLPAGCTDPCPSCTYARSPVQEDHRDLGRWAASKWTVVLLQTKQNPQHRSATVVLFSRHKQESSKSVMTLSFLAINVALTTLIQSIPQTEKILATVTYLRFQIQVDLKMTLILPCLTTCMHSQKAHTIVSAITTTTTTILWPCFPGPPGWDGARRELLDLMVQGEINRGRHTDHLAGCHSIRINQCPPPP